MEIIIKKKNLKKITASAELLLTHLRVKQLCLEEQAVQNYRNRFVELRTWYRELYIGNVLGTVGKRPRKRTEVCTG